LDAVGLADGVHLERVGDHEPVVPKATPEQAGDDGAAQRRRQVVERGDEDVSRHDRVDAGLDRCAERRERGADVAGDERQLEMGIGLRVAVSGEMLRARGDAMALEAAHERSDVAGNELGARSEGANADHRVLRVLVHVGDGREVEVDPYGRQVGADRRRDPFGQLDVVDGAEGAVPGVGAAAGDLEPGDVAALLVDSDQRVARPRAHGARQPGERVADVEGEGADPAEAVLEASKPPPRRLGPREARKETARRTALETHPRTAPAVRPNAMRRWTMRKKITTRIAVSVAPAIRTPQSMPRLVPVKLESQIVSVCFRWSLSRM